MLIPSESLKYNNFRIDMRSLHILRLERILRVYFDAKITTVESFSLLHFLGQLSESLCYEQCGVHKSLGAVGQTSLVSTAQGRAKRRGFHAHFPAGIVDLVDLKKQGLY